MTIVRIQLMMTVLVALYAFATLPFYLFDEKARLAKYPWLEKHDRTISRVLALLLLIVTILRFVMERGAGA
ncbi:MAG: hypothetical protein ACLUOC_01085 [Peptoniphilaceae bacterium]